MANVDAIFYLGENHPHLRYRYVRLQSFWATPEPIDETFHPGDQGQAVYLTAFDIPEGMYTITVTVVFDEHCRIFDGRPDVFGPAQLSYNDITWTADITVGVKDYCGQHNCPRLMFVCPTEAELESGSSFSSLSFSSSSVSSSSTSSSSPSNSSSSQSGSSSSSSSSSESSFSRSVSSQSLSSESSSESQSLSSGSSAL